MKKIMYANESYNVDRLELIEALENPEKEAEFCAKYPYLNLTIDNHLITVDNGKLKLYTLG